MERLPPNCTAKVSYYKSVGLATEGAGIRAGCLHGWAVVGHGGERRLLLRGHGERSIASQSTQLVAAGTASVPWIINDKASEETLAFSVKLPVYPLNSQGEVQSCASCPLAFSSFFCQPMVYGFTRNTKYVIICVVFSSFFSLLCNTLIEILHVSS